MPSRHSDRGRALSAANEKAPPSDMYNAVTAALEEKLSPEELYPAALMKFMVSPTAAARNTVAQTLGLLGDIEELNAADFGAPHAIRSTADAPDSSAGMMPSSEEMARMLGGNPDHPSWLWSALIAPGPGEILAGAKVVGKALLGGGKALLAGSVAGFPVLASRVERRIRKNVNRIDEIQDAIELRKSYGASDESLEKLIKEQKQLEFENRGLFDELSREAAKPTTSGVGRKLPFERLQLDWAGKNRHGPLDVLQNPSPDELGQFRRDIRTDYLAQGFDPNANPLTRMTQDADGNKWYWRADMGTHGGVEDLLKKQKLGDIELNQNRPPKPTTSGPK